MKSAFERWSKDEGFYFPPNVGSGSPLLMSLLHNFLFGSCLNACPLSPAVVVVAIAGLVTPKSYSDEMISHS